MTSLLPRSPELETTPLVAPDGELGSGAAGSLEVTLAKLKAERDRYVALAFAAADMLIEIGLDRRIRVVSGACQALCGRAPAELLGTDIRDLADSGDRAFMHRILDCLTIMGRLDPVPVRLQHKSGAKPRVLMGACQLPTFPERIFMSMTILPSVAKDEARDEETGLLTRDGIIKAAQASATDADASSPRQLSLIRLDGLMPAKSALSKERAQALMQEIGAVIRAASLGGNAAGRLSDEEFGLVHGAKNIDHLPAAFGKAAADAGLAPNALHPRIANLDLGDGSLSEEEAARALAYAVKHFNESGGADFSLSTLADGLPAAMQQAIARFTGLAKLIDSGQLQLSFQPIVAIDSRNVQHYEVLTRFPDGSSPYETIAFSEEVGLIEDLDMAVVKKAFAEISGAIGPKIAVNLSGRSVQSPMFRDALKKLITDRKSLAGRVLFELTESHAIQDMEEAGAFLQWLRSKKFKVGLDDFGSGAAAYSYLRHFDVDFVKIDGPFLKAAAHNPRERTLIGSICRLCAELGTATIGEMIETNKDAEGAAALGVIYGQGWLYGRPTPMLPGANQR